MAEVRLAENPSVIDVSSMVGTVHFFAQATQRARSPTCHPFLPTGMYISRYSWCIL